MQIIRIALAALALSGLTLPVQADQAGITDITALFTTFDGATGIPLPKDTGRDFERIVGDTCNPPADPLIEGSLQGGLIGMALDFAFSEIQEGQKALDDSFTRSYFANKNIAALDIPVGQARCIAIARLQIDADRRIRGYYSLHVLALVRDSEHAFVVRPLYLHTPVLKNKVPASGLPKADAAISVSFVFIDKALDEVTVTREFSVQDYATGKDAGPHVFALSAAIGAAGGYHDFEDSAYLPYHAGRPVSIAIAVTETGERSGGLARLFRLNAVAMRDSLKQAIR
ncbi:MAG: hypothetical protein K8F59_13425 [Rhodobacteraceae bacterium]|nr:hypothetical protein [Paracoccaceae bacterium]